MLTRSSFMSRPAVGKFLDGRDKGPAAASTDYAAVLLKAAGEGPFLLQKRRRGEGVEYAGRFSLFGGRRQGAESLEGAAVRKVFEETGLKLETSQLTSLGQIQSPNEAGQMTSGVLFLASGLDFQTLQDLDIKDGQGVFMKRSDISRHVGRLTSIAQFALSAFEERERTRQMVEEPAPLTSFFSRSRRR